MNSVRTPFDFPPTWTDRPDSPRLPEGLSDSDEDMGFMSESRPMSPAPKLHLSHNDVSVPFYETKLPPMTPTTMDFGTLDLSHNFSFGSDIPVTPRTPMTDDTFFPPEPEMEMAPENSLERDESHPDSADFLNFEFLHPLPVDDVVQRKCIQQVVKPLVEPDLQPVVQREQVLQREQVSQREQVQMLQPFGGKRGRPLGGKRGRPLAGNGGRKEKSTKTTRGADATDNGKSIVCLLKGHGKCKGKVSKTGYQHDKHLRDVHQTKKNFHCFFCKNSFSGKEHTRRHLKEHCKSQVLSTIRMQLMESHPNVQVGDTVEWSLKGKDGKMKTHKLEYIVTQNKRNTDTTKHVKNWVISSDTIKDFIVYKCADCGTVCDTEDALGLHTAEKHEECETCGQHVLPGAFYEQHKSKQYKHHKLYIRCPECKDIFNRTQSIEGEFLDHQQEVHSSGGSRYKRRRGRRSC